MASDVAFPFKVVAGIRRGTSPEVQDNMSFAAISQGT